MADVLFDIISYSCFLYNLFSILLVNVRDRLLHI